MKSPLLIVALAAVAFPGAVFAQQAPSYRVIALDLVPAPVRETLMKAAGTGRVDSVHEVTRDAAVHYRAELDLADDTDVKLYVNADGTVSKSVTDVRREKVPATIFQAFTRVADGNGKVEDIEQINTGGVTTWQAEIDRENQADLEVILDAAGKVLSQQEEGKK